ncbi:Unknown protein, partial [Striga hermonthica]
SSSLSDRLELSVSELDHSDCSGTTLETNRGFWTKLNWSGARWTRLGRSGIPWARAGPVWAAFQVTGLLFSCSAAERTRTWA